ncbi:MAG: response regulator [Xanthomonadaceae bacterium]|nr:response regulator [Xanthomonadaceae bacterium]
MYILLVEDNDDDIELTQLAFEQNRIANRLDVVKNGEQALSYLFRRDEFECKKDEPLPALILLDLKLPGLHGLEVLEKIRADSTTCHLPVVILTSSREQEDMLQSYERGANSFIRKPVDFAKFKEAVRQLQLYWLVLNESPFK